MSRIMWDMSNMIARGFRSGIHSGHGQVPLISTGQEWMKSGRKKNTGKKKSISDSVSAFQNPQVKNEDCVSKELQSIQEIKPEEENIMPAAEPVMAIQKEDREQRLREAVLWSEILGEPVAKKRQRKRMEQTYGDQSYAGRR